MFHIVGNEILNAILIGADFLNLIDLHLIKGQMTIRKVLEELINANNSDTLEVLKIDVIENADQFNFYTFQKKILDER